MTDWNLYEDCRKRIMNQLQKNNVQHSPIIEKCEMPTDDIIEVDEDCIYNDMMAVANITYRVREENNEEMKETTLADMDVLIADDKNYLVELNKNGCSRYCVCGYCKPDEITVLDDNSDAVCGVQKPKWVFLTEGLLISIKKKMENLSLVESHVEENIITDGLDFNSENKMMDENERCELPQMSYNVLNPLNYTSVYVAEDNDEARMVYKATMEEFRTYDTYMDAWRSLNYDDEEAYGVLITSLTPQQLRREISDILDTEILSKVLHVVCGKLSFCNDWKIMYKYLLTLAFIPKFQEVFALLRHTEVYQVLKCTLNNAVMYNMENAKIIKDIFIKEM